MNDHRLFGCCALGSLSDHSDPAVAFSTRILTQSPTTAGVIRLTLTPPQLDGLDPPDAVLPLELPSASACCDDLSGAFCHESQFFSSPCAAAM